ncbi:MAG: hypothetical protein AVDCRST_MAG22-742 [uncultured Rubrobacteraceae bacterium]|uniref:Uncharacterized protein n=1 Tax=uncultured Rubrobacteraceae bacterium TaxID=349277 RepID=A0A6J4NNX2_9ACTN|nr:MAG: hypothetical protein AVDCRST_MAG22-742 [uncultured Rubrobacteraceae bacterium]
MPVPFGKVRDGATTAITRGAGARSGVALRRCPPALRGV